MPPSAASPSPQRVQSPVLSYFGRHWRGELRPAVAWWVNCVGLTVALPWLLPRFVALVHLDPEASPLRYTASLLLSAGEFLLVPLWQLVGLWRTADHHMARRGTILAGRCLQVAAVVATVLASMLALQFLAGAAISARLAYALGPYRYSVALLPGGREIEVRGGIGFGVARKVEALLASSPSVRRIRLNSGGGSLDEAVRLRAVIQRHDLDTYTNEQCSSACVSAYVGGRHRIMRRGAVMGFHLPRNWEPFSTARVAGDYGSEIAYFARSGVPRWFIQDWLATGQKFWFPSELQLLRAGIVDTMRGPPPGLRG